MLFDDLTYIAPGHIMIGDSLLTQPEPDSKHEKILPLDHYRLMLKRVQLFWSQWQSDYLKML